MSKVINKVVDGIKKYKFLIFMFFYFFYILMEFYFNFSLLNIAGNFKVSDEFDFKGLELLGRTLATFGLGFFLFVISNKYTKTKKSKTAFLSAILFICLMFFYFQERVINKIISSTDIKFRANSEASLILKTGILNGSLTADDYDLPVIGDDKQSLFFNSSMGVLVNNNFAIMRLMQNKLEVYPVIFSKEIEVNSNRFYNDYKRYNSMVYDKWREYQNISDNIKYDYIKFKRDIKYSDIRADLNYLWLAHSRYTKDFLMYKRSPRTLAVALAGYYNDFRGCEDYTCVANGRGKKFFIMLLDRVITNRKDLYEHFFSKCEFNTVSSNPRAKVYIDGKLHTSNVSEIKGENNNYSCHINSKELYQTYYENYQMISYNKYWSSVLSPFKTLNAYANSKDVKSQLVSGLFKDEDVDINKINIDLTSESGFYNALEKSFFSIYESKIKQEYKDNYGSDIQLNLKTIEEFVSSDWFKSAIKLESNGWIDSNDWKINMKEAEFISVARSELPEKITDSHLSTNLMNKYGWDMAKAAVIPFVFIVLSLFFAMINLLNFMLIVLYHNIRFTEFGRKLVKVILYSVVFLVPMTFNTGLSNDPNMQMIFSDVLGQNIFTYLILKWAMGVYYFLF